MNKVIAVILAGGSGKRFGSDIPKQFVKLAGKTVIEYTIDVFNKHSMIDEIIVVVHKNYTEKLYEIIKTNNFSKVYKVLKGGKNRFDSTYITLQYLKNKENKNCKILFHDAVRPFVDSEIITECIKNLNVYEAIDTAIDSSDTIIRINDKDLIKEIPNRKYMKRGQTPQGFRLNTILKAYEKAIKINKKEFTCDCGVVKNMLDCDIKVIKSNVKNIKITYPIDLYIAEKYIQMNIKNNFDSISLDKLKDKNIIVFGASSGIGKDIVNLAKIHGANVFEASRKYGVDIKNRDSIQQFLNKIKTPIDIVINTAAILVKKPLEQLDFKTIEEIINTNYIGAVNIAYLLKPYLEKTKGVLINFASSSYTRGRANYALYSSSKAAIVNLTQALSEEWNNIRVNCISPERTDTLMRKNNFGYEDVNTLLNPEYVAMKTLQLALSNVTGVVLDIKKIDELKDKNRGVLYDLDRY